MTMICQNAIITSATLSNEDHGVLSSFLNLDFGDSGQGFGGYALFSPGHSDATGLWIWRCMECAGVSRWKDLPGKTVRVHGDHSKIHAIGHIVKDIWFNPSEEFVTKEFITNDIGSMTIDEIFNKLRELRNAGILSTDN